MLLKTKTAVEGNQWLVNFYDNLLEEKPKITVQCLNIIEALHIAGEGC